MSSEEDFNVMLQTLTAIPADRVQSPKMPIKGIIQEAENLYHWAQQDRDALATTGFDVATIETLQPASGALRFAEGDWFKMRIIRAKAQRQWNTESPQAFALRDQLLHSFRFAYRNSEELLARVREMAGGGSVTNMIQDLANLHALGLKNRDELEKINFDCTLLEKAADTADRMGNLHGAANADTTLTTSHEMRNRAYTYLKEVMSELRACGKYVFYRDEERLRGYVSYYRKYKRSATKDAIAELVEELA